MVWDLERGWCLVLHTCKLLESICYLEQFAIREGLGEESYTIANKELI